MMKCAKCQTDFTGNFCPKCGTPAPRADRGRRWPVCGKPYLGAYCPNGCNAPQRAARRARRGVTALVVACSIFAGLFALVLVSSFSEGSTDVYIPSDTYDYEEVTRPLPDDGNWLPAGMYKVGTDIPAGTYVILCTSEYSCYFSVLKDSSGKYESTIASGSTENRSYISVADGQYLEIHDGGFAPIEKAEPAKPEGGVLPEGMYAVGRDITPGEYRLKATEDYAYYAVYTDASHSFDHLVSNDSFENKTYVTLEEGQYIELDGAEILLE